MHYSNIDSSSKGTVSSCIVLSCPGLSNIQARAFKAEIDSLTTRSRFAENSFLALYKLVRETPDPVITVTALANAARAAFESLEGWNPCDSIKPRDSLLGLSVAPGLSQGANVSVAFELSAVQHSGRFFLKDKVGEEEATPVLSRAQNIKGGCRYINSI